MKTISILGILVALIPFLGIPSSWKTVLFVVFGIVIFAKAYSIMRDHKGLEEINHSNEVLTVFENEDSEDKDEEGETEESEEKEENQHGDI